MHGGSSDSAAIGAARRRSARVAAAVRANRPTANAVTPEHSPPHERTLAHAGDHHFAGLNSERFGPEPAPSRGAGARDLHLRRFLTACPQSCPQRLFCFLKGMHLQGESKYRYRDSKPPDVGAV
jgi:hypothetical protein